MNAPIFLSYPKPCFTHQKDFIETLSLVLKSRGLEPRTLGVTDYDMDAPLKAIRRLMLESNGLITIAFKRTFVEKGTSRFRTDLLDSIEAPINGKWLTSPWAQIEPAMAYQIGLPILILREKDVLDEGILEKGIVGIYMPEFDLNKPLDKYFESLEWIGVFNKWVGYVNSVLDKKGNPPQLY